MDKYKQYKMACHPSVMKNSIFNILIFNTGKNIIKESN